MDIVPTIEWAQLRTIMGQFLSISVPRSFVEHDNIDPLCVYVCDLFLKVQIPFTSKCSLVSCRGIAMVKLLGVV